jgi:hypothetical protein
MVTKSLITQFIPAHTQTLELLRQTDVISLVVLVSIRSVSIKITIWCGTEEVIQKFLFSQYHKSIIFSTFYDWITARVAFSSVTFAAWQIQI